MKSSTVLILSGPHKHGQQVNAKLSRSRRGLGTDEALEHRTCQRERKQKGRRLWAPVKGWAVFYELACIWTIRALRHRM
jgi:hypothetical protein